MELVKIDPAEYGLEENKAKQISDMFKPMLERMVELEDEYNEVIKMEVSPETCAKAKELRLKYVKVRTGTAAIHKELKAFYLQGGRFVDGWKNAQLMASQGIENKLSDIENHFEIIRQKQIAELQEKRASELQEYELETVPQDMGQWDESVWQNFLAGVKANHEAKLEEERKAEEDRQREEQLDKREAERKLEVAAYSEFTDDDDPDLRNMGEEAYQLFMNELKDRKQKHDEQMEQIRQENARIREEQEAEAARKEQERKEREERFEARKDMLIQMGFTYSEHGDYNFALEGVWSCSQEQIEQPDDKEFEAYVKAIKEAIERKEESDRVAAELKAKQEEEERKQKEEEERIQAELNKGDKDKVVDLINDLEALKKKYTFKSKKNKKMYEDVCTLIDKVINHVNR